jgi:hypothetical protein
MTSGRPGVARRRQAAALVGVLIAGMLHVAASLPPMGMRVRLKASFDISGFSPRMQVILVAMQRYGMILADNGSPWFFSGTSDARWDDDELNELKSLRGSDFEVVNTTGLVNGP